MLFIHYFNLHYLFVEWLLCTRKCGWRSWILKTEAVHGNGWFHTWKTTKVICCIVCCFVTRYVDNLHNHHRRIMNMRHHSIINMWFLIVSYSSVYSIINLFISPQKLLVPDSWLHSFWFHYLYCYKFIVINWWPTWG